MTRPRILLADDHRLLREAFTRLLEADCEVVGAVEPASGSTVTATRPSDAAFTGPGWTCSAFPEASGWKRPAGTGAVASLGIIHIS